jgi:dTDP-D-glucose 4,6-dehydratase
LAKEAPWLRVPVNTAEIAELLVRLMKGTENYQSFIRFVEDRPFNDSRYFISNEKLKQLGWKIRIPFMEGIKNLIK